MKKLIIKTSFFVVPLLLLFLFTSNLYNNKKGDLLRLGYIADNANYNFYDIFKSDFSLPIKYMAFSKLNLNVKNKYSIMTIGDSFSNRGTYRLSKLFIRKPQNKNIKL